MKSKTARKVTSVLLSVSTSVWLAGASVLVPGVTLAQDNSALIQQLQAQIAALQAQLNALAGSPAPSAGSCSFSRDLTMGSKGDDVTCLQNYLTSTGHFSYSGGATGYFGSITKSAVSAWQASMGVSPAAGYFGPISRAKYSSMVAVSPAPAPAPAPGPGPVPAPVPAASGTLRVDAGQQPSASLFPKNATRVPFTVVMLTAPSGQDITVNSLVVERTGLAQDAAIDGVVLLDETGAQVGIAKTLNSSHQTTLTEPFVVKAGTTRTMTVGGNATSDNTSYAGQVAYLSLVAVNSSAASVVGTLPITGAGHTVNNSLTIGGVTMLRGSLDPGSSQSKKVGETGYVFSSVKVTASSAEKVYLKFIRWNQTGSVGAADLANVKTWVDGTGYDAALSADGKYYVSKFNENGGKGLLIDKGFSKELSVKGDIAGGSGRTVDFDLAKRTDIGLVGENFGYGITPPQTGTSNPTDDTAAFSSVEDPWYDAAQVTVTTGTVVVAVSSSVPAQNITTNVPNQPLGAFSVEVKGEAVSIGRIGFNVTLSTQDTTQDVDDLTNVALVDGNGLVLAGPIDGSATDSTNTSLAGHGSIVFTDTVTLQPGSYVLTLKGKVGTDFANATTIQASTTPSNDWALAKGQVTGNTITPDPTSAITSSLMTVRTGALSISVSSVPIAQTVIAGSLHFLFANYILDATASGEDIRVTTLTLANDVTAGGAATDLTACVLYDGAVAVSESKDPSSAASTTSITLSGSGYVIPKGTSKTLAMKCNIRSGATGRYAWGLDPTLDDTATTYTGASGITSGQTITETVNGTPGQYMSASSGGTITVVQDSNSPAYKIIGAGQTGVELARVKFSAQNEDIDLKQVALLMSSAASNTPVNLVNRQVTLWDGATQVATAQFVNSDNATSSSIAPGVFRIPRDGSKVLTIKGDIAGVSVSGPMVASGDLLIVDYDGANVGINGNYGTGVASGNTVNGATGVNGSSAASSAGVRIMKAYPTLAQIALTTSQKTLGPGTTADQKLYRFSTTANNGDVALYKFSFSIGSSTIAATTSLYSLYVYTDSGFSNIDSTFSATGIINASQCFSNLGSTASGPRLVEIRPDKTGCNQGTTTYVISSGVTRYFELRATVANVESGTTNIDSISVTLDGDAAFPVVVPVGGISMNNAAQIDADVNDDFIWSPVSTSTQISINDQDFTNGYQVTGLPSVGMTTENLQSN